MPSGYEILRQLEGMIFGDENAGKAKMDSKKKGKKWKKSTPTERQGETNNVVWKKKNIFFRFPYWKDNLLRHNLNVIHIEKNMMDNILNTIMDIKGKAKDNLEAYKDL